MIDGNKVYLKSIDRKNLEQFRRWRNQEWLRDYFREYREITEYMQEKWYENIVSNNDKFVNFEIIAKMYKDNDSSNFFHSNVLVGMCGLYYINWKNRSAEFTIYIGEEKFRRNGFGTDALKVLLRYGFNEMNLNRVWCEVFEFNKAIDIYKKLGFIKEGKLRQSVFTKGKYYDSYILSMLRSDFNKVMWNN